MANLLLALIGGAARHARNRFIQQTQRTAAIQTEFLAQLLQVNRNTVLGQALGLGTVQTLSDFRQQVPVTQYSTYEPYVERMFQGEQNVMTPDPAIYFSITSGSTGNRKMLPITKRSRQAVSRANQVAMGFAAWVAQRDRRPLGKMLFNNSARPFGYSPQGIAYGPISVGDINLLGPIYQQVFAHPVDVLRIEDGETRNYLALLFALRDRNLGLLSATFPLYALTFCQAIEHHAPSLIHDLKTGTLPDWLQLDSALKRRLTRQWRSDPHRAAELAQIFHHTGHLYPKDAWPKLSFMITARGGTSDFYFERFPEYFGDLPIFGGTYSSAEAVYGMHRDFGTDGAILAVNSGFYEFIPESEWEATEPQTVLPHEVNVGDRYRILVTALNGLYRYDIGDVVEIEGFYHDAPMLIFRHRRGGLLSATTEKTTEYHLVATFNQLQTEFNLTLTYFCVTLSDDIPPHYRVNIELAPGQVLNNPDRFIHRFDQILASVHASYAYRRPSPIPDPRLRILAPGSFNELRRRSLARGVLESQLKLPHLTSDRTYLDGITVEREVVMR
ncbi:GH3 auxin-responsive promoter family protein [Spirulina major]|uniref:GH3 auxin-responsive promoter family protein n=1 Tax=Spirulina major TaxID=270636 RepID=UPI00093277A1|nr:GH3 auxin-responsive promoter family protein [Spirulina major]